MTPLELLLLYIAFRAKQVIGDYFLQTSWMATSKGLPLLQGGGKAVGLHAGIHAAFTFLIVILFAPSLWWLGFVDFAIHGAVDRYKAVFLLKRNLTNKDAQWWWAYGLDQEAHNMTHLVFILLMLWSEGGLIL